MVRTFAHETGFGGMQKNNVKEKFKQNHTYQVGAMGKIYLCNPSLQGTFFFLKPDEREREYSRVKT